MSNDDQKVVCQTPTPEKQPTRIAKWKYDIIASTIIRILSENSEVYFKDLPKLVENKLDTGPP